MVELALGFAGEPKGFDIAHWQTQVVHVLDDESPGLGVARAHGVKRNARARRNCASLTGQQAGKLKKYAQPVLRAALPGQFRPVGAEGDLALVGVKVCGQLVAGFVAKTFGRQAIGSHFAHAGHRA